MPAKTRKTHFIIIRFYQAIVVFSLTTVAFPFLASAANFQININEIAWMGNQESANDEWIELKNNTDQEINLTGWILKAEDGTPEISLQGTIAPNGYFLLERTDDNTLPEIIADQIYTGALNNSGEFLELYNPDNNLIDSINAFDKWPAGDNETKQTMEKINSDWQNSANPGGTPKQANSSGAEETEESQETEQETATTTPPISQSIPSNSKTSAPANQKPIAKAGPDINALTNQKIIFDGTASSDPENDSLTYFWNFGDGATETKPTTTHAYQYPGDYLVVLEVSDGKLTNTDLAKVTIYSDNIIISEFIPNPEGKDSQNEWIELHNQGSQTADLSDWQLDDMPGGSRPFVFPPNTLIAPGQFIIFQRPLTKLALNNDEDQIRLIYPDGNIATEISYLADKKQGQAIAFDGNDYFWTTIPTPGITNIISSGQPQSSPNYSSNNPDLTPQIKTSQKPSQTLTTNLSQPKDYQTNQPATEQISLKTNHKTTAQNNNTQPNQAAFIYQSSLMQQNPELILYLCITISVSLLAVWITMIKGKKTI